MNPYNQHGIISLILVVIAFILGIIFTTIHNLWLGLTLIAILIFFFLLVPKYVCSKCPMRGQCGHVVMGKISILLSSYCPDKFSLKDLLILLATAIPLVVVPQFFLISKPVFIIIFWMLLIISIVDILLFVCPNCSNIKCPLKKCPLNKNYKRGAL